MIEHVVEVARNGERFLVACHRRPDADSLGSALGLIKTLRAIDFPSDGSISLEYEANPDNPIDDIQQCLAAAEEAVAEFSVPPRDRDDLATGRSAGFRVDLPRDTAPVRIEVVAADAPVVTGAS